jgi:hypothetical protein
MSESTPEPRARPTLDAPELLWAIVEIDLDAERGPDAIGPFTTRQQAQAYADLTNRHGSLQPAVIPLAEESRLKAPDPDLLATADSCLRLEERLNRVGDDCYPRIFKNERGYTVLFGFSDQIVEYDVSESGEHMRRPKSGPMLAIRSYKLQELTPEAREKVVALAEQQAGLSIEQSLEH